MNDANDGEATRVGVLTGVDISFGDGVSGPNMVEMVSEPLDAP